MTEIPSLRLALLLVGTIMVGLGAIQVTGTADVHVLLGVGILVAVAVVSYSLGVEYGRGRST